MRGVIINADDFGYDEDTFRATVACFEAGLLTSATILAGRPATAQACRYARDNQHRQSFGLHFNIVEGWRQPASSSLCRKDGSLFPPKLQRARAMAGLIDAADIRREFRLQLEELRDQGVDVSHVDGHGHMHKYPAIMRVLREEMLRAGISRVRRPQNCYFMKNHVRGAMNVLLLRHFGGLRSPDFYVGADTRQRGWALQLPAILPEGVTEMSVHPGYTETWRQEEGAPLMEPGPLGAVLKDAGITLMRYHDI